MDPLTHSLTGFTLSKLITKKKILLFVLILSSLIPDIDVLLRIYNKELFLTYHRGVTHGVFALILFPLIPATLLYKKTGFLKTYFISFLGYLTHILLDLTNQYGTKILSPIDNTSYNLSLTFIVDPYILLPLLFAVGVSIKLKKQAKFLYVIALVFIASYITTKAYLKVEAKEFLKQKIEAHQYRVYPLPNDFLRWWFVARFHEEYTTGFVDLFTKRVYIDEKYKIKNDEAILKSKESKAVRVFLSFAKHPVAVIKKEGDSVLVLWKELAYGFLPNDRFTVKVWLKETFQGYRIINSHIKI
ncbi:MAG: metal-dependent hydrolase [Thermodesulfovibrio sp.]|nr:metal-dependent hydrolase [Thermodesulfovibrio sp.]